MPGDFWRPIGGKAPPHWPTGTAAANHATPYLTSEADAVVPLASATYAGANHTHLTELLRDREGIDLSRPTVRHILARAGLSSPRHRRPPKHRVRRQRMP